MINIKKIKKIIGICFVLFGLFWAIIDRVLCKSLCVVCSYKQLSPVFSWLFL